MTVVHNANSSGNLEHSSMCGDGVFLSSHARDGATVIAASGEIDASNIAFLTAYTQHHLAGDRPVVIDLADLDFLGAQGIPALFNIDLRCADAGVQWAVVPSHPVSRLLRICNTDGRLPTVASVDEALERFSSPSSTRQLLKLVTKTS
jgi:anti-anti-sigma factor